MRLFDWMRGRRQGRPEDADVPEPEHSIASRGRATHSVVLRLDPSAMENPDLELRWEMEKMLRAAHAELWFYDDGYGFARHSDAMLLSYATHEPERLVDALVEVLTTLLGKRLELAAMIAVAVRAPTSEAGKEFENHRVVYPPDRADTPLPD